MTIYPGRIRDAIFALGLTFQLGLVVFLLGCAASMMYLGLHSKEMGPWIFDWWYQFVFKHPVPLPAHT
jgi:hypothetical protein